MTTSGTKAIDKSISILKSFIDKKFEQIYGKMSLIELLVTFMV